MHNYLALLEKILTQGHERPDRTGTGTLSLFGEQLRFNLERGFPIVTTKKVHFKSVVCELLWMYHGRTDVQWLQDKGVTIWNEWSLSDGTIGKGYGKQWRNFGGVDQIAQVIEQIKRDPYSRRHIVSAWNPPELPEMALAPCHCFFQFYVRDGKLSCHLFQRSADIFLGVPYNISSYSLLTHIVARECGLGVGELIISFGDVHLYSNHIEQAKLQLTREPLPLPTLVLGERLVPEDISLTGYEAHPAIKAPVAV